MISDENKNAIKALKKAIAILTPRGAWCQGANERNGAYCAMGALRKAATGSACGPIDIILTFYALKSSTGVDPVVYNDNVAKRKSQVIAKFRKAIKLLESGATF
jgi:hypothetical protein